MKDQTKVMQVRLFGAFSVTGADGSDLTPRGRKTQALIALLCTGHNGRRTRAWIQAHLWSDRSPTQAAGSLRASLHELRSTFGDTQDVIIADRVQIQIDLSRVSVDIRSMSDMDWLSTISGGSDFMEGLDVADQEFNAWLTEQRAHYSAKLELPARPSANPVTFATATAEMQINTTPDWNLALCVLPLQNRTPEGQNLFAGNGLSEDLIDMLQRLRWLPVVRPPLMSPEQINTDGGKAALAETLGAKYYVDGSITQENNARVARFRLTDAEDCRVLWSDRYVLDQILSGDAVYGAFTEIVSSIERSVARAYQRMIMNSAERTGDFQDQIWRGRWHLARLTREDSDLAKDHLKRAIGLRPHLPEGLIQMAFWHLWHTWVGRGSQEGLETAEHFARQAMELDPDDGRAFAVIGIAQAWQRNHDMAVAHLEQAIELNPNLAIAHHQIGSALLHSDKPEEAKEPLNKAMRYSPRDQLDFAFQTEMAVALARTEAFEEAYVRATRALMMKPNYWYGHLVRMLAADRLGDATRISEAQRAFERTGILLDAKAIDWLPFDSDDWPNQLRKIIG